MAQDEYYYEIQLTNKQLVFYFMAGAAFLVMSFLAGIVVGRGVDSTAEATTVQAAPARVAANEDKDKIVTEESQKSAAPAQDPHFSQLEADKQDYRLEKPASAPAGGANTKSAMADGLTAVPPSNIKPPAASVSHPTAAPPPAKMAAVKVPPSVNAVSGASSGKTAAPVKAQAKATSAPPAPPAGAFAIQVGAFKDRASADSIVSRLKGKGFSAYVVTPEGAAGGLFNVRVGAFGARPQAEKVEARLRDEERFKPFIVKQ